MWEYKYSDELYHWKYISKKKVNGKWRYTYDYDLDNKYKSGAQDKSVTSEKTGENEYTTTAKTVTYKDSNKLLSSTKSDYRTGYSGVRIKNNKTLDMYQTKGETTRERGVIERVVAKGEKWIYENFFKADRPTGREKNVTGKGKKIYRRDKVSGPKVGGR